MTVESIFNDFISEINDKQLFVEGVAIADGEKVLLNHRFVPDRARIIYSHTKSFTSTAAGMAIDDGLLSLDCNVADFFPEAVPENCDSRVLDITLDDLLTMRSGFGKAYLMGAERKNGYQGYPDYVKFLLSREVVDDPGTRMEYSNGDTYLVGRMIEKAVGTTLINYLADRLFRIADIPFPIWGTDSMGHSFGASDLMLRLTDQLKLGQIFLNGGKWQSSRIVSEDWVRNATSAHVTVNGTPTYGYQWWMSPWCGGYRADGAFGQITTVIPKKGLIASIQCPEYGKENETRPCYQEFTKKLSEI